MTDIKDRMRQGSAWYHTMMRTRWQPQDRDESVELSELNPSHRKNLYAWIEHRASAIAHLCGLGLIAIPGPNGDMASMDWERYCDAEWDEQVEDPVGWVQGTPFMVELRRLIREDEARASRYRAQGHAEPDVWAAVPVE